MWKNSLATLKRFVTMSACLYIDVPKKITMADLLHGGEREARHVWGVYHDEDATEMSVQVLKQQDGPAKPNGELEIVLSWIPEIGHLIGRD